MYMNNRYKRPGENPWTNWLKNIGWFCLQYTAWYCHTVLFPMEQKQSLWFGWDFPCSRVWPWRMKMAIMRVIPMIIWKRLDSTQDGPMSLWNPKDPWMNSWFKWWICWNGGNWILLEPWITTSRLPLFLIFPVKTTATRTVWLRSGMMMTALMNIIFLISRDCA